MLAWACDADGVTELRDEPPLGLGTVPFWGLGRWDDPVHVNTRRWLREEQEYSYLGPYGGAGSPHFPYPSGFDLANRLLDRSTTAPDPLEQLVRTPMDQGLACESWHPETGEVATGAAMASMAGLLVWCAEARGQGIDTWNAEASVEGTGMNAAAGVHRRRRHRRGPGRALGRDGARRVPGSRPSCSRPATGSAAGPAPSGWPTALSWTSAASGWERPRRPA